MSVPALEAPDDADARSSRLSGRTVAVTATRKAGELRRLLERRGATVVEAPTLKEQACLDHRELRATTETVLRDGVDVLVATTGTGMNAWLDAVAEWGLDEELRRRLRRADILARGPKSVGAIRRHGLRELWAPDSEMLDDVLAHLRGRDLAGRRLVLQEHGQSLEVEAQALRRSGADVTVLSTYRCRPADDLTPVFALVDRVLEGTVDAVTFTSSPAVTTLLQVASAAGCRDELVQAFRSRVVAMCVGPVTAATWRQNGVPALHPKRSRLASMVSELERELAGREAGTVLRVAGRSLAVREDQVSVDGVPARLTGAPLAVLVALAAEPGRVLSRRRLMTHLPSGYASSEHAVEMAVARLRAAIGNDLVQTVVKRGYRLPVDP